jgi:hypothetical protein
MTYDNEAIVRHAYHTAEGSVLDVAGFVGSKIVRFDCYIMFDAMRAQMGVPTPE